MAMEEPTGLHPPPVLEISRFVGAKIELFTKGYEKKMQEEQAFIDKFNRVLSKYFNAVRENGTDRQESKAQITEEKGGHVIYASNLKAVETVTDGIVQASVKQHKEEAAFLDKFNTEISKYYNAVQENDTGHQESKGQTAEEKDVRGAYALSLKVAERVAGEIVQSSINQLKREAAFLTEFTQELLKLVTNNAELSPAVKTYIRDELGGTGVTFNITDLKSAGQFHSVLVTRYVKLLAVIDKLSDKLEEATDKVAADKLRETIFKGVSKLTGLGGKGSNGNGSDAISGHVVNGLSIGGTPIATLDAMGLGTTNGKKGKNARNSIGGLFAENGRPGTSNFLATAVNMSRIRDRDRLMVLQMPRVKSLVGIEFNYKQIYAFVNDVAGTYDTPPANLFVQSPGVAIPSNEFLILLDHIDMVRGIDPRVAGMWWETKRKPVRLHNQENDPFSSGQEVGFEAMSDDQLQLDASRSSADATELKSGTPNRQSPVENGTQAKAKKKSRPKRTYNDNETDEDEKKGSDGESHGGLKSIRMNDNDTVHTNGNRPSPRIRFKVNRQEPIDNPREVVVSSDRLSSKEAAHKAMVDQLLDKLLASMGKVVTAEEIDRLHRDIFLKSVRLFKEMIEPLDRCTSGEQFDDLLRNYITPHLHMELQTRVRLIRSRPTMSGVTIHELMVSDGVRVEFANLIGVKLAFKESQRANSYFPIKVREALSHQVDEATRVMDNLMCRTSPYVWHRGKKFNSM